MPTTVTTTKYFPLRNFTTSYHPKYNERDH